MTFKLLIVSDRSTLVILWKCFYKKAGAEWNEVKE